MEGVHFPPNNSGIFGAITAAPIRRLPGTHCMTSTFEPVTAPGLSPSARPSSGEPQSGTAESNDDDPYSPGLLTLLDAIGGLLGVVAILLPLATVLVARPPSPDPPSLHGSEPAAGIPSARAREPGGGDPRRLAQ